MAARNISARLFALVLEWFASSVSTIRRLSLDPHSCCWVTYALPHTYSVIGCKDAGAEKEVGHPKPIPASLHQQSNLGLVDRDSAKNDVMNVAIS